LPRRCDTTAVRGTLVGRDAALDLAVATLQSTGRLVVEGPAGIGKTALLRALTDLAAELGMTALRCAPTESEGALAFAALADLLGPLAADLDRLPPPQQRAARSALLLEGDSVPVDERALGSALRSVLDTAAERTDGGVLVAIDDAQWLDPLTERALRFALRRTSAAVRVMAAVRTDDEAPTTAGVPLGLDAHTHVERLGLMPLGVGPLHRLLAQRFGVSLSRPVVARLARESKGNPLLAIELTRVLAARVIALLTHAQLSDLTSAGIGYAGVSLDG
jgi:predicted ATPase